MNLNMYMDMSLEELRMLGDETLIDILNELSEIFDSMAQCFDEDLVDWLEALDDLFIRVEYVLEMDDM